MQTPLEPSPLTGPSKRGDSFVQRLRAGIRDAHKGDAVVFAGCLLAAAHEFAVAPESGPVPPERLPRSVEQKEPREFLYDLEELRARGLLSRWQDNLANEIALFWRVSNPIATEIVSEVFDASRSQGVDFTLVLAVIAQESSFRPNVRSATNAEGLMQVDRRWHPTRFAGLTPDRELSIAENIQHGTAILRGYLDEMRGDVEMALQAYNGARTDEQRTYAKKVLAKQGVFKSIFQTFLARVRHEQGLHMAESATESLGQPFSQDSPSTSLRTPSSMPLKRPSPFGS
jgi:Transglycosylase SLT domain